MKSAITAKMAALVTTVGLLLSPTADARNEPIGRSVHGIECDESMADYSFDDGDYIYYCDGRQWYIVGRL